VPGVPACGGEPGRQLEFVRETVPVVCLAIEREALGKQVTGTLVLAGLERQEGEAQERHRDAPRIREASMDVEALLEEVGGARVIAADQRHAGGAGGTAAGEAGGRPGKAGSGGGGGSSLRPPGASYRTGVWGNEGDGWVTISYDRNDACS